MRRWYTAGVVILLAVLLPQWLHSQDEKITVVKTKAQCERLHGEYDSSVFTIGSDGSVHPFSLRAPNNTSELLGAYIKTKRNKYDNGEYPWTCPVNVPDPSPENIDARRCSGQAQDMTVEYCKSTGGNISALSCAFVNAAAGNAGAENPKDIEIFACWSK